MKKKEILILIIFIIVFAIGGILFVKGFDLFLGRVNDQLKEEKTKEEITPLMYEVTKDGSNNKIYLFGSIHVANLNEFNFPKYVMDAYNKSKYLACEFDVVEYEKDTDEQMNDIMKMAYTDGTTIKEHISKDTYNKLVKFLTEKNLYTSIYDIYKPFFFQSLLTIALTSDAKINAETGIDNYFLKQAKKDNKNILEVESSSYQTDLLLGFSDSLYELILKESIDNYDEELENLKKLYAYWKSGNIDKLLEISNDDLEIKDNYTKKQVEEINEYNKKVVDDRNISMTNKLIEYFNNNYDTFYMVGTLHLIGESGIAKQLEAKGFTVKQINQ